MKPPKNFLLPAIIMYCCFASSAQNSIKPRFANNYSPKTNTIFYKIGETLLPIKIIQYGDVKDMVYINLHDDEESSVEAAKSLLVKEGGTLIRFENKRQRNIRFKLHGRYYIFDPNRMFSREGIAQTLTQFRCSSPAAINEIQKLGQRIIQLLPKDPLCVVALHNNTDGRFGVNSYLPEAAMAGNAKLVYENPGEDPDDIFFTTDSLLFHRLAGEKFNTIWQDNVKARRDGSLSIYCGEKNIRYVNCETEHGKTQQYLSMLLTLSSYIDEVTALPIAYNFELKQASPVISQGQPIYFGNKKIGTIRTVLTNDTLGILGKIEIDPAFKLYSNVDFFLLNPGDNISRIEARVDPTREKRLLGGDDVISIHCK